MVLLGNHWPVSLFEERDLAVADEFLLCASQINKRLKILIRYLVDALLNRQICSSNKKMDGS